MPFCFYCMKIYHVIGNVFYSPMLLAFSCCYSFSENWLKLKKKFWLQKESEVSFLAFFQGDLLYIILQWLQKFIECGWICHWEYKTPKWITQDQKRLKLSHSTQLPPTSIQRSILGKLGSSSWKCSQLNWNQGRCWCSVSRVL